MANLDLNIETQLKEMNFSFILQDELQNEVSPNNCTHMLIYQYEPVFMMKTIKLPKNKMVDFDYIMTKLNNDKVYQSFAENFKNFLKGSEFENSMNIYPTTYGIGFFVLFNFRGDNSKIKAKIDEVLNSKGIEYKNEYSDAGWVFRYKISKCQENIKKLA